MLPCRDLVLVRQASACYLNVIYGARHRLILSVTVTIIVQFGTCKQRLVTPNLNTTLSMI